jgi:hypothetical protein
MKEPQPVADVGLSLAAGYADEAVVYFFGELLYLGLLKLFWYHKRHISFSDT